ncbi:type II toxin-antitoxin system VapC family toxin [Synechococcus sp. PCC 7336]|uniref:type II toxin-antitoxin system VapC family toxin n=1 Tax=Synechococcus sp. PCC 7336 TaxID=195250 RepID=UPI0003451A10|nr:hypothetical protein [Synechococcus sp. PCC 7336]
MIFVDTGAWYASIVPSDSNHPAAATGLAQSTQILLTTDYVIDETLTLLRARRESQRAIALGDLSSMALHGPHPRPLSLGRGEQQPQTLNLPFCSPAPKITADATLREGARGSSLPPIRR